MRTTRDSACYLFLLILLSGFPGAVTAEPMRICVQDANGNLQAIPSDEACDGLPALSSNRTCWSEHVSGGYRTLLPSGRGRSFLCADQRKRLADTGRSPHELRTHGPQQRVSWAPNQATDGCRQTARCSGMCGRARSVRADTLSGFRLAGRTSFDRCTAKGPAAGDVSVRTSPRLPVLGGSGSVSPSRQGRVRDPRCPRFWDGLSSIG